MEVIVSHLGRIEYDPAEVIEFAEGLYGFEHLHRFIYVEAQGDSLFGFLQSLDDAQVAFVVAIPGKFIPGYSLSIFKKDYDFLDVRSREELLDLAIVTVPENIEETSANLLGPVLINVRTKKGRQVISQSTEYGTKHRILADLHRAAV
ncbi:MAG: flagellar assembly protein FliW [Spirochaetia bacterium]|nr:flagellar assembly protein FliW [Spirochaetia bacterium]